MKNTIQHTNISASFFFGVSHTPFFNLLALKHFVILSEAKNLMKTKCFRSSDTCSSPNITPQLPEKTTASPTKKPGMLQYKNCYNRLLSCLFMLLSTVSIQAQQVCENNRQQVILRDGVKVLLFKEISGSRFYFVPTALQLSINKDMPEFSYQEYTKPDSISPDGAILHLLLRWGLTKQQRRELILRAKELYGEQILTGSALQIEPVSGIKISNKTRIGKILNTSLQSKGNPPTTSGGKIALSFHIGKNKVKIMSEALKKPSKITETNFSITYNYKTCNCSSGIAQKNTITLKAYMKKWLL